MGRRTLIWWYIPTEHVEQIRTHLAETCTPIDDFVNGAVGRHFTDDLPPSEVEVYGNERPSLDDEPGYQTGWIDIEIELLDKLIAYHEKHNRSISNVLTYCTRKQEEDDSNGHR